MTLEGGGQSATVRDAFFDVLRAGGLTTIFSNPGSTEVALLADLLEDLQFVMALHEGSVVGMATGHALARNVASLVLVHTTAGLGNAVGALVTRCRPWGARPTTASGCWSWLANGRYAIMDRLVQRRAAKAPWPTFEQVSLAVLADGFGCPARRIDLRGHEGHLR